MRKRLDELEEEITLPPYQATNDYWTCTDCCHHIGDVLVKVYYSESVVGPKNKIVNYLVLPIYKNEGVQIIEDLNCDYDTTCG